MTIMKAHTQEEFKTFMSQLLETNANLGFYTDFAKCHLPLCLLQLDNIRQFGIKKCPKKLVISLLFCNFIVDNQLITNIYSDDYH